MTDHDLPTPPRPMGHVEPTPEAGPLSTPPTLRDHLRGPIPGVPPSTAASGGAAGPTPGRPERPAAPEPPPAPGRPSPDAPIPLLGPGRERPGGGKTWGADELLKPLAAVALILAVNALRLLARGVSGLAESLDAKRTRE